MNKDYTSQDPIRVLHIVTTMNRGGLETMLMNYYRHIDRKKVQFDFLVHREEESDYEKEIILLGGKVFRLSKLNPFSIHYRNELYNFFHGHLEYQIVHVHQDCLSSIALKEAFRCKIPIRIAHSHNARQDLNLKYIIKYYFMKHIPKYATHLFACGKDAGDWMFCGKDYMILNNAINATKFSYNIEKRREIRNSLNLVDETVIGHIGRFDKQKNHDFLIEVFNQVNRLDRNTRLCLVGQGKLEKEIKEKVKKLGLYDKVLFLGKRDDINELLQAMDVFVFPSLFEGLPVTVIEAQASGLPIIKSENVSKQCVITPNVFTLSLNDSPLKWAQKILEINKVFNRKDTAQYIINNHYDINENAKWFENFYLNEVKKHAR